MTTPAPTHWMDDRGLVVTDDWLRNDPRSTSDYRAAYHIPCVMKRGKAVPINATAQVRDAFRNALIEPWNPGVNATWSPVEAFKNLVPLWNSTVVYCVDHAHAKAVADTFADHSRCVLALTAKDIARFFVTPAVSVLVGVDLPLRFGRYDYVIMARPTNSAARYEQMTRTAKHGLIDLVGNVARLGMPRGFEGRIWAEKP